MTRFRDIADWDEDERIEMIGHRVMGHKEQVVFIVESDVPGKKDRYIQKLKDKFPGIRIIGEGEGPVEKTVYVKLGPPEN